VSHRRSCPFVVCRGCFSPVDCTVSVSPLDPSSFPSLSFFRSLADMTSIARYSFRRASLPFCPSNQLFQPHSRYGLNLTPCMVVKLCLIVRPSQLFLRSPSCLIPERHWAVTKGENMAASEMNLSWVDTYTVWLRTVSHAPALMTRLALQETRWYHPPCMFVRAL